MDYKLFDLNIEKVLDHWGIEHAIREIIANAIDETVLSRCRNIDINYSNGECVIRDYGRGIMYNHFTQNENIEKQKNTNLIGKFGVGLKDALGVLYNNGINVTIHSKYHTIKLIMSNKANFTLETLHAVFYNPQYKDMEGTEFRLQGVTEKDVDKAKKFFIYYNDARLLEKTSYGDVYRNSSGHAKIYVNGVQIAEEENFMFSYNITNVNSQLRKALNRERSNVGRTAYSTTVKNILKSCKSDSVLLELVKDINNSMYGTNKDETGWADITAYAATVLSKNNKNIVFMTPSERAALNNQQVEILEDSGKQLVLVTDTVFDKISEVVNTFKNVQQDYEKSFVYKYVDNKDLYKIELDTLSLREHIDDLIRNRYNIKLPKVVISETIQPDLETGAETLGIYRYESNDIVIKRSVLSNNQLFCSVLIHEYMHYITRCGDNTRGFENGLTDIIGYMCMQLLKCSDANINLANSNIHRKKFRLFSRH